MTEDDGFQGQRRTGEEGDRAEAHRPRHRPPAGVEGKPETQRAEREQALQGAEAEDRDLDRRRRAARSSENGSRSSNEPPAPFAGACAKNACRFPASSASIAGWYQTP